MSAQPTSQVLAPPYLLTSLPDYVVTSLVRFSVSSVLPVVKFFLSKGCRTATDRPTPENSPFVLCNFCDAFPATPFPFTFMRKTPGDWGPESESPADTAVKTLSFSVQPAFGLGEVGAVVA